MKILLACEGQSEVYLLNSLIKRGYLSFDHPLLLDEPIKLRQLTEIAAIINSLPIAEEIIVYRIGDTLKDDLSLSKFKMREKYIKSFRVCTKTEIEVLVIINEGWLSEFLKEPKNTKPKSFVNKKLSNFNPDKYFSEHDMVYALKEYKRIKKHNKGERYLIDLIENKESYWTKRLILS